MRIKGLLLFTLALFVLLIINWQVGCGQNSEAGISTTTTGSSATTTSTSVTTTTGAASADIIFIQLPFDVNNVGAVSPLGYLAAYSRSNPSPAHMYGQSRHLVWNKVLGVSYEVYAPATAEVVTYRKYYDYGFYFGNSDCQYFLDHIGSLAPSFEALLVAHIEGEAIEESSPFLQVDTPFSVPAGMLIGYTGAQIYGDSYYSSFDWGFLAYTSPEGIVSLESYPSVIYRYARSVYDYSSDDVKEQLRDLAGRWLAETEDFISREGEPPLGAFGCDVVGTLQGVWFYDKVVDPDWGQKIAVFSPYYLNSANLQIGLHIPDIDMFGAYYDIVPSEVGREDRCFANVTTNEGIVGYVLQSSYGWDDGLLLVQMVDEDTLKLETRKDILTMPSSPSFSASAILLTR
ncbi:MAG: hypothetical protein ABIE84_07025 [bacterium]